MNNVIIIGAGGHGKVVLDVLLAQAIYRPVGFIDDNPALAGASVSGYPILGSMDDLPRLRDNGVRNCIIAVGDNLSRLRFADRARTAGIDLASAIHPTAFVSPRAALGRGVLVAPHATVVTEAQIRDLAIVNTAAVVDHECDVGEGSHIGPGTLLAGRVRVGRGAFVGMGAIIIQCRSVGAFAKIGAGAVVLHDVPDDTTAVGVPARVVRAISASPTGVEDVR